MKSVIQIFIERVKPGLLVILFLAAQLLFSALLGRRHIYF